MAVRCREALSIYIKLRYLNPSDMQRPKTVLTPKIRCHKSLSNCWMSFTKYYCCDEI